MTNSTLVSPVKMEFVPKANIFGLKMMLKRGLEKIILKFLHALAIFCSMVLPHRKEEF
jgi:hypothetical protein